MTPAATPMTRLSSRTGRPRATLAALALLAVLATAAPLDAARAESPAPPQNVVTLSASATLELPMDWLTVVFSTSREGSDATAVQSQLRLALDTALTEARKAARPGALEVSTGAFSLLPRYMPAGGMSGWQGSAELIVQGRDTQAIAQLAGRVKTLSIARVAYSLSREAREKVEAEVTARAIARFRARAEAVAREFGFGGYTVREVAVSGDEGGEVPMPRMRLQAARAMAADESLPVEAGKATVTRAVSGSVQMK